MRRGQALLFRFFVAAPGRKPDTRRGPVFFGSLRSLDESVRKARIELPQSGRIVPAIVEEKAVEFDAALPGQLLPESLNRTDGGLFVESLPGAQVVPGVVMQKRSIRMGALKFDIFQKIAAQLSGMCNSDYRRIGHALSCTERKLAREPA